MKQANGINPTAQEIAEPRIDGEVVYQQALILPDSPFAVHSGSAWFDQEFVRNTLFIGNEVNREVLLRGVSLPSFIATPLSPDQITPQIVSEVSMLTRALALELTLSSLTAILTKDGKIFFGQPRIHSHPVCSGDSVENACGIAVTSGHHSFALVATYSKFSSHPPFNGLACERLAEHFCDHCGSDMALVHVLPETEIVFRHRDLLPYPSGGQTRPEVNPTPFAAYRKFNLALDPLSSKLIDFPKQVLDEILLDLLEAAWNSTADSITRPGRKRHSACVITADGHAYYGVNLRSDVGGIDRCAEWNALSGALLGGHLRNIVATVVFSPDYDHGFVSCCGRCRDSLGDCLDPAFGDMLIAYADDRGIEEKVLFSEMKSISYGVAERQRPGLQPTGEITTDS